MTNYKQLNVKYLSNDHKTKPVHNPHSYLHKHENHIDRTNLNRKFSIGYLDQYFNKTNNETQIDQTLKSHVNSSTNVYQSKVKIPSVLKQGETLATKHPANIMTINTSTVRRLKSDYEKNNSSFKTNKKNNSTSNVERQQEPSNSASVKYKPNLSKAYVNNQNSAQNLKQDVTTYANYSYMDMLRMYQKQKFLEEYIKNNGDAASQIIPNFLYLGGHNSIIDIDTLNKQGITHVLNMAQELNLNSQDYNNKNIKILQIGASDTRDYNIRSDFDAAFMFIDDCLRSRGRIIVNCARGISRSATIVIAYLMFRYNLKLVDAYKLVVSLRRQVRPNLGFRNILTMYELELNYVRTQKIMGHGMKQESTSPHMNMPLNFYHNRTKSQYSRQ
ncbi:unnamed protein product [Brachionus calyciflorus]|uniref:protein-tyrosine-phosphatase n=1 Tax=Brachionus calyciflorus TaxID=104777 RepID=A0A813VNN5_9BILA|nr:unnamed protein product [Brachionus calyciflorus]